MAFQEIIGFIIFIMFVIAVFNNHKLQVFLLFILGVASFIYTMEMENDRALKIETQKNEMINLQAVMSKVSNGKLVNISPIKNHKTNLKYRVSLQSKEADIGKSYEEENKELADDPKYTFDEGHAFIQFGAYKNERKAEMELLNLENTLPKLKNFIFIHFDQIVGLHRIIIFGFKDEGRAQHFIHKHHLSALAKSF